MKPSLNLLAVLAGCVPLSMPVPLWADERDQLKVGLQPDGRIVVPTNQILGPAGAQVAFPGRPVDLVVIEHGRTLAVKNFRDLVLIDLATGKVRQTLPLAAPAKGAQPPGFSVVGLVALGDYLYASDALNSVQVARRQPDGSYAWERPLPVRAPAVGGAAHPAGLAVQDAEHIWSTSTRGNNVQLLHAATGEVKQVVAVGVAPYAILPLTPERCYVTNWGGDPPGPADPQGITSGTPVRIDPRTNVANQGTVSVLQREQTGWKQVRTIPVGVHPSGMARSAGGRYVYVANANSDTVSVIDTGTDAVVETIACRPEGRLPFGSGSNAVTLSPDGGTLYVANGTNNCVAVVRLGRQAREADRAADAPETSTVAGLIPTGWYPGAVHASADGKRLFVANVKGHGALSQPRPIAQGRNSRDHLGTVSLIDVPDREALARYTAEVNANNRLAYSLAGLEKPRPNARPVPVPARHGEPSVFEHVIYIIKENRTYDQVFGDMKEGNGDPKLCIFGEEVTPNHHKLAREFTLFDNFYCSGVLSADGHSWVNEAYVTDYLEKSFGGFTRSYPYEGSDPLAFPTTGFLWDNALAHRRTFRNYGEFVRTIYTPPEATWNDVYADFRDGTRKVAIEARANLKSLEPYTHPRVGGFPLKTPDVYRAQMFLEEFREFEKRGQLPNLIYLFLPADHTVGTRPGQPTPRAMVADNDLALGRVVEAVSRSRFWPKTCLFVVEDDPQNGFDHVDGHRTVAFVLSPYTRRKFVDSTCYNQTGMVKTIELILGLPPMNQMDLSATAMRHCFQQEADLTPYTCAPNRIALDELNKPLDQLRGQALDWARRSLELDFEKEDRADEDTLNRILWFAMRGEQSYPGDDQ
jgi:YVTN family beta-propeller protein